MGIVWQMSAIKLHFNNEKKVFLVKTRSFQLSFLLYQVRRFMANVLIFSIFFPFKTITHRGRKYICLIKTNFD